jgi:hypothetical protein
MEQPYKFGCQNVAPTWEYPVLELMYRSEASAGQNVNPIEYNANG